jgi:hypothetical protein
LEGARKRRLTYTPSGLWQAWKDLDAATKVYIGSVVGFMISVSRLHIATNIQADNISSFPPLCCSSARAASTATLVSSVKYQLTTVVAEASNGMSPPVLASTSTDNTKDSFYLRSAILDGYRRPVDTMEDPTYQRRAFLGMADQAGNHRWVGETLHSTLAYSDSLIVYLVHHCGLHLPFQISKGLQA